MAEGDVVTYDEKLAAIIQETFIHKIVPQNFLLLVHKHDDQVLTSRDIERLRKKLERDTDFDVNIEILSLMKRYQGWFECLLKVVQDRDLKQSYLVKVFQDLKRKLDEEQGQGFPELRDLQSSLETDQGTAAETGGAQATGGCDNSASGETDQARNNVPCVSSSQEMRERRVLSSVPGIPSSGQEIREDDLVNDLVADAVGVCDTPAMEGGGSDNRLVESADDGAEDVAGNDLDDGTDDASDIPEEKQAQSPDSVASRACAIDVMSASSEIHGNGWIVYANGTGNCDICRVALTSRKHADQHLNGRSHRGKERNSQGDADFITLGPKGETHVFDERGRGRCFVCNIEFNSRVHGESHIAGSKHKSKCAELKRQSH